MKRFAGPGLAPELGPIRIDGLQATYDRKRYASTDEGIVVSIEWRAVDLQGAGLGEHVSGIGVALRHLECLRTSTPGGWAHPPTAAVVQQNVRGHPSTSTLTAT